jgi:hypothetical protein
MSLGSSHIGQVQRFNMVMPAELSDLSFAKMGTLMDKERACKALVRQTKARFMKRAFVV